MVNQKQRNFYGRRQGRPIRKQQAEAIDALLPQLCLDEDSLTEDGALCPSSLFKTEYKECWFEIGFGTGEHLSGLMRRHPENAYIGAEPFMNGMGAFLKDIRDEPNERIRVYADDAMVVAKSLADESLNGMYILNPDPWHKTRHHKRRMVRRENLEQFARIIKPGGQLILSTDVPYLADWMITETLLCDHFKWQANSCKDWQNKPEDWITTAYEVKGAKGAQVMSYLFFERI